MPNPTIYPNGQVQYGAAGPVNYQQTPVTAQPMPWQAQPMINQQPVQPTLPRQVMSIAAIRGGRLVAEQFPVAAGTELWLIDKEANKIYIKTDPMNPSSMIEADYQIAETPQPNQNESVSREEFNELKGMLAQLTSAIQSRPEQQQKKQKNDWKRGNRDAQSGGVPADDV